MSNEPYQFKDAPADVVDALKRGTQQPPEKILAIRLNEIDGWHWECGYWRNGAERNEESDNGRVVAEYVLAQKAKTDSAYWITRSLATGEVMKDMLAAIDGLPFEVRHQMLKDEKFHLAFASARACLDLAGKRT